MKKLLKKLLGKKGESLVESMASILIFTLTSIALMSMIMSSAKVNTATKEANETYREQIQIAERGDGDHVSGTVTFAFNASIKDVNGNGIPDVTRNVDIYQAENEGALYSYFEAEEDGT